MRVPLSWLRDFAPFDGDAAELATALDDLGLVVEETQYVGRGLEHVVLARVLEIATIAGADKIRRVVVDGGDPSPVEVVCGAWNFAEGDLVALAPVGAVLPGDFEITRRKMKGVVSNGMLCSGSELRLSEDHEGILVIGGSSYPAVMEDPGPGTPIMEVLGIEPDVVFDVAVDANRPDAASVAGVARDLAARLRLPFSLPDPPPVETGEGPATRELTSLEVVDRDLCPRFTSRVVEGVVVGPSPQWISRRLMLAGMRPINNVVDASNYVMIELGQPTHPYDLDRVTGGGLRVRAARPGEQVVTLDGITRTMAARSIGREDDMRDCLICDAEDSPIGIGGVMGGETSEISEMTKRVLLEAAYFTPMAIARTSKRLSLRTEASARFERGVDHAGIDRAARRLVQLLAASAGPSMSVAPDPLDVRGAVPEPRRVHVRTERVNALLGCDLTDEAIAGYLEPIGFECEIEAPGRLDVTVPTFRADAEREVDVVEEVARHHGYSRIPRRRVFPTQVGKLSRLQRERRVLRAVLAGVGADEVWTPSLLGPADHERAGFSQSASEMLELTNPLTPEESVLRRSLLPGMLRALEFNASRRQGKVRLFEIGKVFSVPSPERVRSALAHLDAHNSVVDERESVAMLLARKGDDAESAVQAWWTLCDALRLTGVELRRLDRGQKHGALRVRLDARGDGGLHPTRTAAVMADETVIGTVGEIDPVVVERYGIDASVQRVGWMELDLSRLLLDVARRGEVAGPVSRFPSSDVDLAFAVDETVPATSVTATLEQAAGELLESIELFDVYRGEGVQEGTRSLAWRLRFCALDHTLTEDEIGRLRATCIEAVEAAYGAVLRA